MINRSKTAIVMNTTKEKVQFKTNLSHALTIDHTFEGSRMSVPVLGQSALINFGETCNATKLS